MLKEGKTLSVVNVTVNSSNVTMKTGILGSSKEISYRDERKHVNYHHYPTHGPCVSIAGITLELVRSVATRAPPQKPPELKPKFEQDLPMVQMHIKV